MSQSVAKLYEYPDGSREGSVLRVAAWQSPASGGGGGVVPVGSRCAFSDARVCPFMQTADRRSAAVERADENRERSVRRSSTLLRRHVRMYNLTRLLTFTNGAPGGWASPDQALDDVMRWITTDEGRRLLQLESSRAFVAVAEPGGVNGRWHVHGAIPNGYRLDYRAIIRSWSAFLASRGYESSSVSGLHRFHSGDEQGKHKTGFSSARVAAIYLAKYLRKALGAAMPPRRHRFRTLNAAAVRPRLAVRTDSSLTAVLAVLGIPEAGCYRLEFVNGETGELVPFGFLFDTGG